MDTLSYFSFSISNFPYVYLFSWSLATQRKKRLNTVPYFTVLGQITSIYRHTKTIFGNIQDRIQAVFIQCDSDVFIPFFGHSVWSNIVHYNTFLIVIFTEIDIGVLHMLDGWATQAYSIRQMQKAECGVSKYGVHYRVGENTWRGVMRWTTHQNHYFQNYKCKYNLIFRSTYVFQVGKRCALKANRKRRSDQGQ